MHGLFVALHCAMLSAIPITFLPRFSVDEAIDALASATVMMGVPTQYGRLLADPRLDRECTAGMRLFTSGSAPLTEAVFAAFAERTGHRILERYGMSEAGIITSNPYDGDRVAGTVGFPLPGVGLRVVDPRRQPRRTRGDRGGRDHRSGSHARLLAQRTRHPSRVHPGSPSPHG